MNNELPQLHCRVCGFEHLSAPWGDDDNTPLYEICPCCGVTAGYEDSTPESATAYRQSWLDGQVTWSSPSVKPEAWSLELQLTQVPSEFKP